jgi:eukaryotic-like serine/threonine-protein kinase
MNLNKIFIKRITLHLSLMAVVGSLVVFLFFEFLLPALTQHGQFITIPNLKGISLEEVDTYLAQRNLRFEVTEEFVYAPDYPPMTVVQQYPKVGGRVKAGRKIYLTLNTQTPPQVKMPDLVDGSVRNAHVRLKSQGLLLGSVKYVPDFAQNAVLEQWHKGEAITAGTLLDKDSKVDLVVGAGLGSKTIEVPQIVGMPLEDAKSLLLNVGLQVGNMAYEAIADQVPGTILRQRPDHGHQVNVGENIDLWLVARPEEAMVISDAPMLPGR